MKTQTKKYRIHKEIENNLKYTMTILGFGGKIMTNIKFGTDGWRSQIAKDFTFENVEIVAQAIANYIKEKALEERGVVIGYDNRFLSPEFGQACAKVLAGNGIKVLMTDRATPTPVIAFSVVHYKAAGAIMLTASHNPAIHNGIKFIPEYGGPANKAITDRIVEFVAKLQQSREIKISDSESLIEHIDPEEAYISSILKLIDADAIRKANLKVVVNPMFGAGIGYTDKILKDLGCQVETINNYRDTLFGGKLPDPNIKNMEDLIEKMKLVDADLGLATDGDADRFGVIDKKGNFISPNQVLYLLMSYLIRTRGWKTCVTRTVATTYMLDRLGQKYGIEVIETPVGFKYIAEGFMYKDAFLGGEESGGLSIKGHVPEKDGVLACLLITEMVAKLGKSPTEIMEDLKEEVGYLYSGRLDIHCSQQEKERILEQLKTFNPEGIADNKVIKRIAIDGAKLVMEDGSWVLVRPSGTEALFRVYAEGNTEKQVKNIHDEVAKILGMD